MTPEPNNRIKIAVQKSGRLTDHSLDLLSRCGLKYSKGRDQLICFGENLPIDVLLVRDDDIPALVREDVCDLGIVGANVLEERRLQYLSEGDEAPFVLVRELDFGHCRLSFAVPEDMEFSGAADLEGLRIATSYPHIVRDYLRRQGLTASVVEFSGAVEIAPRLGRADVICDLVSSGNTLRANHLREAGTILSSVSSLIQTPKAVPAQKAEWMERIRNASMASYRSARANTSCCTRPAPRWQRSPACYPAPRPPRSCRWKVETTRWPSMPYAAKMCSGKLWKS